MTAEASSKAGRREWIGLAVIAPSVRAISETSSEFGGALGIAILGSIGAAIYRSAMAKSVAGGYPPGLVEAARGAASPRSNQKHLPPSPYLGSYPSGDTVVCPGRRLRLTGLRLPSHRYLARRCRGPS